MSPKKRPSTESNKPCPDPAGRKNQLLSGTRPTSTLTPNNGLWRSLVSAPALGAGGRRFKSGQPDPTEAKAAFPASQ